MSVRAENFRFSLYRAYSKTEQKKTPKKKHNRNHITCRTNLKMERAKETVHKAECREVGREPCFLLRDHRTIGGEYHMSEGEEEEERERERERERAMGAVGFRAKIRFPP